MVITTDVQLDVGGFLPCVLPTHSRSWNPLFVGVELQHWKKPSAFTMGHRRRRQARAPFIRALPLQPQAQTAAGFTYIRKVRSTTDCQWIPVLPYSALLARVLGVASWLWTLCERYAARAGVYKSCQKVADVQQTIAQLHTEGVIRGSRIH